MSHSEHDSHFSFGLFCAEQLLTTSYWRRQLQKNDTVEVASEKEGFLLALTKTRSKMVEVSACSVVAQTCASKTSFAFLNRRFLIMEKGLQ